MDGTPPREASGSRPPGHGRAPAALPTLTSAVLLILAWAVAGCGAGAPPNFVVVSVDTLRADHVGAYGYEKPTTPNIDELAARGTLFLESYSHAPHTAPSHTTIFTSLHPSVHGVWEHGQALDPDIPTLAELLARRGYETAAFVELPESAFQRGFDDYVVLRGSPWNGLEGGVEAILDWLEEPRAAPFFLFVHSYGIHAPYTPPEELARRFNGDYEGPLPDRISQGLLDDVNGGRRSLTEADLAHVVAMYDAELAREDAHLGRLFDRLLESGLFEETVVVLLSDHGEEFGEHGRVGMHSHSLRRELLHTPLILAGDGVPEGRRVAARVRQLDLAPTLLALAGAEAPDHMQGRDLAPLWRGDEADPREVLAEHRSKHVWFRTLIRDRYKLDNLGRLYDLEDDPREQRELSLELPMIAAGMRRILEAREELLAEHRERLGARAELVELSPEEEERLRALGYLR